jgi:tryptophanyl-tRNA synthetase
LLTAFPVLPGTDGRKMSKSYQNTIAISDAPETVRKKVTSMVTDPARVKREDKGHPEVCTIYEYYKVFAINKMDKVAIECREAKRGCVECKREMAEILIAYLAPIHRKREELEKTPEKLAQILAEGGEKARKMAAPTLNEAKRAMGLI